jgi:hypothetical protein
MPWEIAEIRQDTCKTGQLRGQSRVQEVRGSGITSVFHQAATGWTEFAPNRYLIQFAD